MANGAELAKAYVTVIPSFTGAQAAISKGLGAPVENEAVRAGKDGGRKGGHELAKHMGDAIKRSAAAIGTAVAAAAAGAAALAKTAIDAAANQEQLLGGVEKIFGEDMAGAIVEDAKNAWMNLNMSANDYLATINDVGANFKATMGAEAGYEAAKTGLQAIADYASGTGKSIDELKEKFALITRSTSSYQSIADQFSGILPATSADFLAQAQAAGLLGEEYEKLTDVPIAEYQAAVAEMLAIGTEELGLAGNAASETLTTVSGSLNALKAAWSNTLAGLASGGDMQLGELIWAMGLSIDNLLPLVENMLNGLAEALPVLAEALVPKMAEVLGRLGDFLAQTLPTLVQIAAVTLIQALPTLVQAATSLFMGILKALPPTISSLVSMLPTIIDVVCDFLTTNIDAIIDASIQLFFGILQALPTIVTALAERLPELVYTVVTSLAEHIPDVINAAVELFGGIVKAAIDLGSSIGPTAAAIVDGFIEGLVSKAGELWAAVQNLFGSALQWVKDIFGIASPSKEFRFIGEMNMSGLEEGMERGRRRVLDIAGSLSVSTIAAARPAYATAALPQAAPALNLTPNWAVYIDGRALANSSVRQIDRAMGNLSNARRR